MADLIDRQAAIDAVEESRRLNHHQDGKAACAHEYEHRHFLKLLRDLPPAQPEPHWIPCKDRMPNSGQSILFSTTKGNVHQGIYRKVNGNNYWYSTIDNSRIWNNVVTAWMPKIKIEPYREGES